MRKSSNQKGQVGVMLRVHRLRLAFRAPAPAPAPARFTPRLVQRKKERGAALVEAVTCLSLFILAFAGILYICDLYGAQMRTMRLARQKAWTYALKGCEGDSPTSVQNNASTLDEVEGSDTVTGIDRAPLDEFRGFDESTIDKSSGTAVVTEVSSLRLVSALPATARTMSATIAVQCNEVPKDGGIVNAVKFAFHRFTAW